MVFNPVEAPLPLTLQELLVTGGIKLDSSLATQMALFLASLPPEKRQEYNTIVDQIAVSVVGIREEQKTREILTAKDFADEERDLPLMATACLIPESANNSMGPFIVGEVLDIDSRLKQTNIFLRLGVRLDLISQTLDRAAKLVVTEKRNINGVVRDIRGAEIPFNFRLVQTPSGLFLNLVEDQGEMYKREVSDLMRAVSHDLKNMVANSSLSVDIVSRLWDMPLDNPFRKEGNRNLNVAKVHLQLIQTFVDQHLTTEQLKGDLNLSTINLKDVIAEIVQPFQLLTEIKSQGKEPENRLTVKCDIDQLLSSIHTDKVRVRSLIFNIFINAMNYTDVGEISVRAWELNGLFLVEVKDTGCGIKLEDQVKIFDHMFKTNQDRHKYGGSTGLGLGLAKKQADQIGAQITFQSEIGKGTTFLIQIPSLPKQK
jgi:signal transduction histidine kinase